jgi:hypothetical protein
MTNEVTINLTRDDIREAIKEYVAKKYPTFTSKTLWLEYNSSYQSGSLKGTIKEG